MAIVSFTIDPNCVSTATFDTHHHEYKRIYQFGVDRTEDWSTPVIKDMAGSTIMVTATYDPVRTVGLRQEVTVTTTPV